MATRHRLSKHFTIEEFDCHDGTNVPRRDYDSLEILCKTILEPMRRKYGPCKVLSGFRTPSHNASVGGATHSYHVYTRHDGNDQAADLKFARGTPSDWHRTLNWLRRHKRNGRGGLGVYSWGCHFDMRDYKADWRG